MLKKLMLFVVVMKKNPLKVMRVVVLKLFWISVLECPLVIAYEFLKNYSD